MWSSRLFWKLFLTAAAVHLTAAIVFATIVATSFETQLLGQFDQRFRDAGLLLKGTLGSELARGRSVQLQQQTQRLGRDVGMRITLVAMDGEVLADSERDSLQAVASMENHKDRIELVRAAVKLEGASQRVSPTLGEPMKYYALRVDREGQPVGIVRLALPTDSIQKAIATEQYRVWMVAMVVIVAGLVLAYWVVGRIIRPVQALTGAAEALAAGDVAHRVYIVNRDELGVLGDAFNHMSLELGTRIDQLQESGQRLATVLARMAEGVIAVDRSENILFANDAAGKLLGFDPTETVGRQLLESVRNHALHTALIQAMTGRAAGRCEVEVGEARERVLSVSFTPLEGDPGAGVVMVLNDVTELRQLESLRQEFVANVSHELKTPLTAIKAYAETLRRGAVEDSENRGRFLERIEEQADRLHQLILDLLALARIESGKQAFDIVAVTVADIARPCVDDFLEAAAARQVTLSCEADPEPLHVKADAEGLRGILNNLVDNAIKYTPAGGAVTVRWRRDGAMAVIDVADTGIGIAAEHQPRLFERFYRVDKARSREMGGTGLGLSIVKHLTLAFEGQVRVTSRPGEGSTFTVALPLA